MKRPTRQKKGAETIIVWMLLIGFTITMTSAVFIYEKNKAREFAEKSVSWGESKMECNSISLNIACNNPCTAKITNTGKFSVSSIIFRDDVDGELKYGKIVDENSEPFLPGNGPEINLKQGGTLGFGPNIKIEVMPIIDIGKKFYACDQKVVELDLSNCGC